MKTENPNLLSPSVLAFVGDAVYGLYVRTALAEVNRPSGELHKLSVTMVNAAAQAKAYSVIEPELTEKEISVRPASKLAVGTLQAYLDDYLKAHKGAEIDYIHGENSLKKLAETRNALGFLFDGMKKVELFDAVRQDGSLPRKTFSMGEADDKRFYLECRKL